MSEELKPAAPIVLAVTALVERGIPTDVLELLIHGDPARGIKPGALNAAMLALSPLPSREDALVKALEEGEQRLTQALGIIVEFGDLNGFRNLSDQELGRAVIQMAERAAATLITMRAALSAYRSPSPKGE